MNSTTESIPLDIIVAEHHPIQSRDQAVIDAAAKLACPTQLCFYFSLDDPVMKHFGTASVKALFERLGIDKGECISHHLVTTAIRTAQENIERRVGKDVPTHSVEDWFKYNLPEKEVSVGGVGAIPPKSNVLGSLSSNGKWKWKISGLLG